MHNENHLIIKRELKLDGLSEWFHEEMTSALDKLGAAITMALAN